jgi:hypothetical protein
MDAKSNDTYLNILVSYAYLEKSKEFTHLAINSSLRGEANVMIDSGAFTLFNAKGNRSWLTIDNYCHFLEQYGEKLEKYVMLDVIGNEQQSKINYELMLKRGFNPMFVFTMADNDYSYLKDAVNNNAHLCVAGGVTTKGDWIVKRFQDVYNHTSAKIHGLGYVTYPNIYKLPLHSVDSSSWIQASQMYGNIPYFQNGLKNVSYRDILTKKTKLPLLLIELFEMLKITPKIFSSLNSHKGSRSIGFLLSIIAHIEYQKYSKIQGVNLFLATCNKSQICALLYVNEHYNLGTLTYENFKKI